MTLFTLDDFKVLEKIHIVSERNKLTSSILRRSKKDNFLYCMVIAEVEVEREMFSEYCSHYYTKGYISLFKLKMIVQDNIFP